MDPTTLRHAITQFVAATVALMMLALGSLGALIIIFGQANLHRVASLEASRLADVEVSQLVGTPNYAKSAVPNTHSVLGAISATLHLPFSDPLSMLTNQLPQTVSEIAEKTSTEASLFKSITTWAQTSNKIALGWLQTSQYTTSSACIQMLKDNPGITVASPTWLQLSDASGNISGKILPDVVNYAHQHNIKVWVLASNGFQSGLTHKVLQNPKARTNMVDELAYQAETYHLDGINIDFENVAAADRDAFTTFIRELHDKLAPKGINLSVDITPDIVPLSDNVAFFHAGLAKYADEIVLMAYDEHWSTDKDPGPVADLPWVTQSVNDLLDTGVPTDKLVLGMPFYTQFWYVHKNGDVTSEADSVGQVDNILNNHNAKGTWNSSLDLMYARYQKPDGYMEVWYPTQTTYADELALANNDGLGGVAVWSLNQSDEKTWSSVVNLLGNSMS